MLPLPRLMEKPNVPLRSNKEPFFLQKGSNGHRVKEASSARNKKHDNCDCLTFSLSAHNPAFLTLEYELINTILSEGLTIIGWVAMWELVHVFFYGWWPIVQKRNI